MAEGKRKISLLGYFLRLINLIGIAAIVLAYLSLFISPAKFWIPAFFGLSYPLWLVLNLYFVFHWIALRRRFFIYPLTAVLLGFSLPSRYVGFGSNVEIADTSGSIKILTYNVHDFDYYSQTYSRGNFAVDAILKLIKKEKPAVLCFQEFYSNPSREKMNNLKTFMEKGGFPYVAKYKYNRRTSYLFLVIYSKFPIVHDGYINNAKGNKDITGIYADMRTPAGLIRVYNTHLNSTQISSEAYLLKEDYDVTKKKDVKKAAKGAKKIAGRMRAGYEKRALQVDELKQHIEASPYPVILAGDFNDTPCSYSYQRLTRSLDDSFMECGKGFSTTYDGIYPSFRIDYVLHDDNFRAIKYKRIKVKASDHYPVSAVLLPLKSKDDGQ